jgi:DNA-binding NtrC family response regulator
MERRRMSSTVLVVDDRELMRDGVAETLQRAGLTVVTATDGNAALEQIARRRPDAVVSDLKMPGMTGIELLEQVRRIDEELPVILMTAFGAVDSAVKAMKVGAFDYLTKPFEGDELVIAVKRALEHTRLVRENAVLRRGAAAAAPVEGSAGAVTGLDRLIGDSPAMRRVKAQVQAVAGSGGTVLICGESGTGKEVVARAIHELSPRLEEGFLAVNCAALSDSLLESELFGHERGAFTGAEKLRKGRFELADRGTLLLDEISEVSTRVQAKLLRVLQERVFERVGASGSIGVDVRVVATSNRDLPQSVSRGEFRQDLFFRLNVLPIHLPALRDRMEDVPALAAHFVKSVAAREGRGEVALSEHAVAAMLQYRWPGNVRELANICERAVVLCRAGVIEAGLIEPWLTGTAANAPSAAKAQVESKPVHLGLNGSAHGSSNGHVITHGPATVYAAAGGVSLNGSAPMDAITRSVAVSSVFDRSLEEIEREAIVRTLQRFHGHRQKTASALGIGVRTLGLKLKKWKQLKLVEPTL